MEPTIWRSAALLCGLCLCGTVCAQNAPVNPAGEFTGLSADGLRPIQFSVSEPALLSPADALVSDMFDAEYLTLADGSVWVFFQEENQTNSVFDDGKAWVARIDPATGQCTGYPTSNDPRSCRQRELADNVMQVSGCSWKGPNVGLRAAANGGIDWRVFYHVSARNGGRCGGRRFIVSRTPQDPLNPVASDYGSPQQQTPPSINRANGLASQDASMSNAYIAFLDNDTNEGIRYQASRPPDTGEQDPFGRAGFRWVSGRPWLVTSIDGQVFVPALDGEIQALDVVTMDRYIVSRPANNPTGLNHADAYGWLPPEYPGTVSFVARIEGNTAENALRVYRQSGDTWDYDRTLSVPNDQCHRRLCAFDGDREGQSIYLQSIEPFSFGGRSYFIGTVKTTPGFDARAWDESEIWLLSYDGTATRLHGRLPGRVFHEAEVYVVNVDNERRLYASYNELERVPGNPTVRIGKLWRVSVGQRAISPISVSP